MVLLFTVSFLMSKVPEIIVGLQAAIIFGGSQRGFTLAGMAWSLGGVASVLVAGLWRARPDDDCYRRTAVQ